MAQPNLEVEVTGMAKLRRRFGAISDELIKQGLEDSAQPGAEHLRKETAGNAPERTGQLRDEIAAVLVDASPERVTFAVAPTKKAYYGAIIEVGWTDRGGNFHPPRPFMRPTFDSQEDRIIRIIRREMRKRILNHVESR